MCGRSFSLSPSSVMMNVEIRNITGVADFGCKLNLEEIYAWMPKFEKKKRQTLEAKMSPRFRALTLRILHPVKATAQLFRTGKVICIGTKSETDLQAAGDRFCFILILLGYQPVFNGFRVCNMVSSWVSGGHLNIEKLHTEHGGIFEPEIFPALSFYVNNVTLLIFHSGKVVATGGKRQEDLNIAHERITSILNAGDYFK